MSAGGLRCPPDRRKVDLVEGLEPLQPEIDPARMPQDNVGDGADDVSDQLRLVIHPPNDERSAAVQTGQCCLS